MMDSKVNKLVERLFSKANLAENERRELVSFVCELFCSGCRPIEILDKILGESGERKGWEKLTIAVNRETPMNLLRYAAESGLLTYQPPFENGLAKKLADEFEWNADDIKVVQSRSQVHVAQAAAKRLLSQIRGFKTPGGPKEVHIGFAGGRQLRLVAEELAGLLQEPSAENPERIVFHAMAAAFSDDDFAADPNNFITYFLKEPLPVEISFVPIAAPGIVEAKHRKDLLKFRKIDEAHQAAAKLNIIVSGGGDWEDAHSTTQRYLQEVDESDVQALNDYPAIGDLLWQPLSKDGPIDMDNGEFTFRPNTLVDLKDLPTYIKRGVRVLLALGPCGKCGNPKGNLLNTIMSFKERLVTDIVTNSPTVYDALSQKWNVPPANPSKPK